MGAIGPGGSREVSVRVVDGLLSFLPVAHGAAVGPIAGTRDPVPAVTHGAFVPASTLGRAVEEGEAPASGTVGRACGPDVAWAVLGGGIALGSRSKLNRDPKGKCCTTGNFDKTSALYILIMPLVIVRWWR